MRKLVLLIAAFVVILSSCNIQPEGYIVEGTLNGGSGKKLYLARQDFLDSTVIKEDGSFAFNGKISEKDFFYMYIDPTDITITIVDSLDHLTVTGDADNIWGSTHITGTKDAELMDDLSHKFFNSYMKFKSCGTISPDSDSLAIASIINNRKQVVDDYRKEVADFIKEHPSSFAALPALYQTFDSRNFILNPYTDFHLFKMVDDSLFLVNPSSSHVKTLHANVLETGRQIEMQNTMNEMGGKDGGEAPDFTVNDPDGNPIKLSSFRGKYVLLDFWASWCVPCRKENPNLVSAYNKFNSKGFEIFQVSLDKAKDAWLNGINADGLSKWKHGSDLAFWNCAPAKMYGVQSIPANFLIDKDGKIIASNLRGQALEEKLSEIFAN